MKQKVYISSTYTDLKEFRQNLIDFINKEGHDFFEVCQIMERMYDDGSSRPLLSECLEAIEKSDIFIIILGNRIGSHPTCNSEKTFIESEYDKALKSNKLIYRYRLKPFDEKRCDDIDTFQKFAQLLQGFHIHEFSNITEFENAYLKVFYNKKQGNSPEMIEEDLVSGIDRKWQVMSMNRKLNTCPGKKVLIYFYFSHLKDFSHLLNFRISNLLLQSRIFRFMEEYFVTLEPVKKSNDEIEITELFVNEIAKNSFGSKGDSIFSIKELYECLNSDDNLKCLVVPLKICHSIDTDKKILDKICSLLQKFSLPENIEILKEKRVIFLLNIQFESSVLLGEESESLGSYFMNNLNGSGIGELEMITGNTIYEWIRENFESNPTIAEEYLQKYFKLEAENTKWMADIVQDARKLVKELSENKT